MAAKEAGPRSATLRDVARESGVSIATVSYSLNGGGTISDDLRERVRQVAERLSYKPNRLAQAVRTGRTHAIGLVLPDLRNPFFPELAQAVEQAARAGGYVVMLIDTQGDPAIEADGLAHLRAQSVDGIVWCRTANPNGLKQDVATGHIPTVVIGPAEPEVDSVSADDLEGGRQIARYLTEKGHGRIGVLSGNGIETAQNDRRTGLLAGLGRGSQLVWDLTTPYAVTLSETARSAVSAGDVTAIVCGNDLIAIGVLRSLMEAGVSVPGDVSVIGFDDIPWSSIVSPSLTTVRQPVGDMGARAVELLLSRLETPGEPVRRLYMPVSLLERQSSGPAPD